jgi:hypothetical protein
MSVARPAASDPRQVTAGQSDRVFTPLNSGTEGWDVLQKVRS